jgi:hypothetical protein
MAKGTQTEPLALEALSRLLGEPAPKALHGSKSIPGIFPGASAAEKSAAKLCLDRGWLLPTGDAVGKGKSRKELYRLAPAGLQAVLAQSDPTGLLRSLADNVARLEGQTAELQSGIADALRPIGAFATALSELKGAIGQALTKVKPVDLDQYRSVFATPPPTGTRDQFSWGDEVVRMAAEQKQRNAFQRLTLPQVFERLRARYPELTLGQFHDGLRRLQDERRIRLGPYTQALATLDDPRNALFLDREVKYYVELP